MKLTEYLATIVVKRKNANQREGNNGRKLAIEKNNKQTVNYILPNYMLLGGTGTFLCTYIHYNKPRDRKRNR